MQAAQRTGVEKFIYVSVFNGPKLPHLAIVKAHEDFVDVLRASGINYAVLRPTGYFSDVGQFLEMARKGRVYLIGRSHHRVNPIHGADLAVCCVDALEGGWKEIDVGGPEILTYREIAALAFQSLGKPARITVVPVWVMQSVKAVVKLFSKHQGELLAFFTTAMTSEVGAPTMGIHRLRDHFERLAWFVFMPIDVFHLRLLPPTPLWVSVLGVALVVAGYGVMLTSVWQNAFATPVVGDQSERDQILIDTGLYGRIRHPNEDARDHSPASGRR